MNQNAFGVNIGSGKAVLIALVVGMVVFGITLFLISGGAVRHVPITLPEKTENTLVFRNIDGEVKLVGTRGVAQVNPTMIMRTGDYAMELTVINEDTVPHTLYIDGLEVSTGPIKPGESRIIAFYSEEEGAYNYYDWGANDQPLGQIRAMKVTMYE